MRINAVSILQEYVSSFHSYLLNEHYKNHQGKSIRTTQILEHIRHDLNAYPNQEICPAAFNYSHNMAQYDKAAHSFCRYDDADYLTEEIATLLIESKLLPTVDGAFKLSSTVPMSIIIESYSKDFAATQSADEVVKLAKVLITLPLSAVGAVIEYYILRRDSKDSLYNTTKQESDEVRLSNHWNVFANGRIQAKTLDKKRRFKSWCMGTAHGVDSRGNTIWQILPECEFGGSVKHSHAQQVEIITQLRDEIYGNNLAAQQALNRLVANILK